MNSEPLIEILKTGDARAFLDACIEHDPAFLEALVAEVCYGVSTEPEPLVYLQAFASRAKPMPADEEDAPNDKILDAQYVE